MKPWLSILVAELRGGRSAVLAFSSKKHLGPAALYDREGRVLAGSLGDQKAHLLAEKESPQVGPEKALRLDDSGLILKLATPAEITFWEQALEAQKGAWSAWLLTIPLEDGLLTHQLISSFGPQTAPVLPEDHEDWILTPLNAGLGRLFVFGDSLESIETAALAGRAGLVVSLISENPPEMELAEALSWSHFEAVKVDSWEALDADFLENLGLSRGVRVIILSDQAALLKEEIEKFKPSRLIEAQPGEKIVPLNLAARAI